MCIWRHYLIMSDSVPESEIGSRPDGWQAAGADAARYLES